MIQKFKKASGENYWTAFKAGRVVFGTVWKTAYIR
jgi:hypothetical protein